MATDLSTFLPLFHRLADASGAVIRGYYRKTHFENKSDNSPVTLADQGAEKAIRAILEKERPQDGVWGEEFGAANMEADFCWIIDPIDGTKSFIRGMPTFATLIALFQNGKPVLGLIDQPILNERWLGGHGIPTTFNDTPVRVRHGVKLEDAVMNATTPDMFTGVNKEKRDALAKACRYNLWGGDAYAYGMVANGFIDIQVDAEMKLHDYAALVPVIEGAGGRITGWEGEALGLNNDGRILAVGDPALYDAALKYLRD